MILAISCISPEYHAACEKHGLVPWAGDFSKWQPADIADVLLHETAVSWVRAYMRHNPVKLTTDRPANIDKVKQSLKEAAKYINDWYEVDELCLSLPERLKELRDETQGDRVRH